MPSEEGRMRKANNLKESIKKTKWNKTLKQWDVGKVGGEHFPMWSGEIVKIQNLKKKHNIPEILNYWSKNNFLVLTFIKEN